MLNKKGAVKAGDSSLADSSGSSVTAQMCCSKCPKGKTTWFIASV